jgi:hypothetical protein
MSARVLGDMKDARCSGWLQAVDVKGFKPPRDERKSRARSQLDPNLGIL